MDPLLYLSLIIPQAFLISLLGCR